MSGAMKNDPFLLKDCFGEIMEVFFQKLPYLEHHFVGFFCFLGVLGGLQFSNGNAGGF